MITSGVITLLGDQVCQRIEIHKNPKQTVDWRRSAVFSAIGCFYQGPSLHFNYTYVLPYMVPITGAATYAQAAKKVAFD